MTLGAPCITEILKGQIFLGNLSAALCLEIRKKLGITHVVSICPEYPSTGPNHLTISVDDSEYENLLIHLPEACHFIQQALDEGGSVLVHCVMGISRSTTVVAAYLMKTRKMCRSSAIGFIKERRPQIHPNYGFIKQLEVFADCNYEPSPSQLAYTKWKRHQRRNVTQFLNSMIDTTEIIHDQLLLSSDFPEDPSQAEALLLDLGITHLLSLSPAQISVSAAAAALPSPSTTHHHIYLPERQDALLTALPDACEFIRKATEKSGRVLVHCLSESRACIVVCAYLMSSRKISSSDVYKILQDVLPLFNPTRTFSQHLELFEACNYSSMAAHPLLQAWRADEDVREQVYVSGKNESSSGGSGSGGRHGWAGGAGGGNGLGVSVDMGVAAAWALSDTGLDVKAFGHALARIQMHASASVGANGNGCVNAGGRV